MFTSVVIHSGSQLAHQLRYLFSVSEVVEIIRDLDNIPNLHELRRLLNSSTPDIVIINLGALESLSLAAEIRQQSPDTVVLGYGAVPETASLALNVGFDDVLASDAEPEEFRFVVQNCLRKRRGSTIDSLYCFMPSKAGSGCSTIVMNTAAALAARHQKRVLVLDADLRSGILSSVLGAHPQRSLQATLENVFAIEKRQFSEWVHAVDGVDYLFSSRATSSAAPEWSHYFHLLSTVEGLYDVILVDLPELVNPATYELVRRSTKVFVVCTAEVPSMTLARTRCAELADWKIPAERSGLLINRWHKNDPSPREISSMVAQPVQKTFPNDYQSVRDSILAGTTVAGNSRLGQSFSEFASELTGTPRAAASIAVKLKSLWGLRESVPAS